MNKVIKILLGAVFVVSFLVMYGWLVENITTKQFCQNSPFRFEKNLYFHCRIKYGF